MSEASGAKPGRMPAGFHALTHPGYRLYFVGMLLRGTAVWMQLIGLPWLAVELGATPFELGVVTAAQTLPFLAIAPVGGVIADRVNRARVLTLAQIGVFLQSIAMVGLIVSDSATIPILVVMGAISGTLIAFELPVRQTYLVDLVPPADVTSAVSLHSTAFNTTRFVGPGIAGILIATIGVQAVFATAAVFALGVAVTILLGERSKPHQRPPATSHESIRKEFIEGARYAAGHAQIRTALLFVAAASIFAIQAFQTLAPLFVSEVLGLQGGAYGAYMAAWGAGAVVAAYVVTLLAHGDRRRWLFGGATALAILLAILSRTTWPPLAFALAALLGAGQIALVTNALVSVQYAVTDALRGRVLGFYTTLYQGTSPIGALFAGVLASVVGVQNAMLGGAAALGLAILVALIAGRTADEPVHAEG